MNRIYFLSILFCPVYLFASPLYIEVTFDGHYLQHIGPAPTDGLDNYLYGENIFSFEFANGIVSDFEFNATGKGFDLLGQGLIFDFYPWDQFDRPINNLFEENTSFRNYFGSEEFLRIVSTYVGPPVSWEKEYFYNFDISDFVKLFAQPGLAIRGDLWIKDPSRPRGFKHHAFYQYVENYRYSIRSVPEPSSFSLLVMSTLLFCVIAFHRDFKLGNSCSFIKVR